MKRESVDWFEPDKYSWFRVLCFGFRNGDGKCGWVIKKSLGLRV
jgi:hypothetical protein